MIAASVALVSVTIAVGFLSNRVQENLSNNAIEMYDQSFQSMNYLRLAQAIVLGISRERAIGRQDRQIYVNQIDSALDAVDVAHKRAMTDIGRRHTEDLLADIGSLKRSFSEADGAGPNPDDLQALESKFDTTISTFAADGFRLRRDAERLVEEARLAIYLAIAGASIIALIITIALWRSVVPPIQRAVSFASSIAAGRLDNDIQSSGSSETATLMQALAVMQANIADKIRRIEDLSAKQAAGYVAQIDLQHTRFETALNYMTLGLCMFDADGKLVVRNRRFVDMFGEEPDSVEFSGLTRRAQRAAQAAVGMNYLEGLNDGRIISVSQEDMPGGGRVVLYDDVTERQKAEEHLQYTVRHDALTKLPNRFAFREQLQDMALHGEKPSAIMFLDLDRFKHVNDTLGHGVGDELLCAVADRLGDIVEPTQAVFRLGGDEFAVICSPCHRQTAVELASDILRRFEESFFVSGHLLNVNVSIGVAPLCPEWTAETMLKQADLALYEAKADGRGTYRQFEPSMHARLTARRRLEVDLRAALANEQFQLYYQPIFDIKQRTVVSYEALLRWPHPERGFIPPAEFIPVAEDLGLISKLGRWVLKEACRQAAQWPSHLKVAVNLSPLQFKTTAILADVQDALAGAGIGADRLDLEVTESLMLQNTALTFSILHDLRTMGIRISMDDFGTGYSSLNYLTIFPFDKIKIDQSFVKDLAGSADKLAIIKSVVQLGRSLRMHVVAEGVETSEQIKLLKAAGCQELQGFAIGRPMPHDNVLQMNEQSGPGFSRRRAVAAA